MAADDCHSPIKETRSSIGYSDAYYEIPSIAQLPHVSVCQAQVPYTGIILSIDTGDDTIMLSNNLQASTVQSLLQHASPSPVGKGNETIMDASVRESREFVLSSDSVNRVFLDWLEQIANIMVQKINHPTNVKIVAHKLILYQTGGKFYNHIDACHGNDQIMTISIEIPVQTDDGQLLQRAGGDLIFMNDAELQAEGADEYAISAPEKCHISICQFYHDTFHRISEIESGYRVSVTFDVYANGSIIRPVPAMDQTIIQELHSLGVRKLVIILGRIYLQSPNVNNLKGADLVYYQQLITSGLQVEIAKLVQLNGQWVRGEVIDFIYANFKLNVLYNNHDPDDIDDFRSTGYLSQHDYKHWKINPSDGTDTFIRGKHSLGDAIFLHRPGISYTWLNADEDLYLGNEGFEGDDISKTWALIAYLPSK